MTSATEQPSFFGVGSPALTSDRTDWETPRDLFDRLNDFWQFDLDVAASDAILRVGREEGRMSQYRTKDNSTDEEREQAALKWFEDHKKYCRIFYGIKECDMWLESREVSAWQEVEQ